MSLIFDTHAHYDDSAFDEDRDEVISGLAGKGVGTVVDAGAAARSIPAILELTRKYDFMYMAAGLHPCEVYGCGDNTGMPVMKKWDPAGTVCGQSIKNAIDCFDEKEIITADWTAGEREVQLIRACLGYSKTVAVGEIGLDYHYEDTRKDLQKEWFALQINLAKEFGKAINVHSRDAAADTLDLVKAESARDVGGIIHCFSYSKEMAREFLNLGFMLGMGGVITFKNSKKAKEVVEYMPLDRLVLETDCPYLAPAPFRGSRNDSSMIRYAAQAIADIKGLTTEMVIDITTENAEKVYGIKQK